jgi:hypothetical protein
MRKMPNSTATLCTLIAGFALPWTAQSAEPATCKQIIAACTSAGFVKGDAKLGYGLWRDCIDPIMRGTTQPPKADKPLPVVPPELIATCKQENPNFGEGKKAPPPPPPKGT